MHPNTTMDISNVSTSSSQFISATCNPLTYKQIIKYIYIYKYLKCTQKLTGSQLKACSHHCEKN